jgi:hypothetical protein
MISHESKQALARAVDQLKLDGYSALVIMFDQKGDQSTAEVMSTETNDSELLRSIKKTLELFSAPNLPREKYQPVQEWEVSARGNPDGTWTRFEPGQEPKKLTSISVACVHAECHECQGIFRREDYPDEWILCVHECHLAQNHDSYVSPPAPE